MVSKAASAATVRSPFATRFMFIFFIGLGTGVVIGAPEQILGGTNWVKRVPDAVVVVYLAAAGLATIWLLCRAWRMGVRFDADGVTVRNRWRTYRINRSEVSHFADGVFVYPGSRAAMGS
jgi:hypothetical protein